MNLQPITIDTPELHKLLANASGDCALLYLYVRSGNLPESAQADLRLTASRYESAAATLRQLGLWPEEQKRTFLSGERPNYSEADVLGAMNTDTSFRLVYGEIQRLLGRTLNTEELKILLGFQRYLGLPGEVISLLISYCKDRARQRGSLRNPSLRAIEKEAYRWAEDGIDTLEDAIAYIQKQNARNSRLGKLMELLQIRGRNLTPAEEKYATKWLEMGFPDEVITMAYERTCVNTGGMRWPYMDKILTSWHEEGRKTARQVQSGDRKAAKGATKNRQLDAEEQAAIARMLQEV